MQKWAYLRLAVSYRGENDIFYATANGTEIFSKKDKTSPEDLQNYVENLGCEGWELVNVHQDSQLCEIYHFKSPIE